VSRGLRLTIAALLPLFCAACGDIHKHTTPMIECLRRVENHTPRDHRVEAAKRECGWSPKQDGARSGPLDQARGDDHSDR
jgi:hypothetical protein